jgi:hypothetical protein
MKFLQGLTYWLCFVKAFSLREVEMAPLPLLKKRLETTVQASLIARQHAYFSFSRDENHHEISKTAETSLSAQHRSRSIPLMKRQQGNNGHYPGACLSSLEPGGLVPPRRHYFMSQHLPLTSWPSKS